MQYTERFFDFFPIFAQNIDCGSRKSTHNLCFVAKIRKIGKHLHTRVVLYIVGFKRVYIGHWTEHRNLETFVGWDFIPLPIRKKSIKGEGNFTMKEFRIYILHTRNYDIFRYNTLYIHSTIMSSVLVCYTLLPCVVVRAMAVTLGID